jgi:hypothetical protein
MGWSLKFIECSKIKMGRKYEKNPIVSSGDSE